MLASVVIICVYGSNKASEDSISGEDTLKHATLAVLFGTLSPLSLSLKHIFIRKFKNTYRSWDTSIDGLIFEYQIYIVFSIYYFSQHSIDWHNLMIGTIGSLFIMSGKILIVLAVANGIAGPAASLINT